MLHSLSQSEGGSRRPRELLPAQQMHMQVEDGLSGMLPVIDDDTVTLGEPLLLGDLGCSHQQLPQNNLMLFLSLRQSGQSLLLLGDNEDVHWRRRSDVPKGEDRLVLIDHVGRDLPADELVEDSFLSHACYY